MKNGKTICNNGVIIIIILKPNAELKRIFQYVVKTVGVNVEWTGYFIVTDNRVILPGKIRSLILDLEHKKAVTNIIDNTIEEKSAVDITGNETLGNILNMVLYAFGKWELIKGLKVEKNMEQLNRMFSIILREGGFEPEFKEKKFRFYKNGVQVTYEEVVESAIIPEPESEEQDDGTQTEGKSGRLGLWHNMKWTTAQYAFEKGAADMRPDEKGGGLGNHFYRTDYKCPVCGDRLHMVIYPPGREFRIETDEGGVYLARAYTCSRCHNFYTPRPEKLIREGDIYELSLEEDEQAYEDYIELLGREGGKDPNYKFNEYEARRSQKQSEETLEEMVSRLDSMTEKALRLLKEKMEDGFYSDDEVEQYYDRVKESLDDRRKGTGLAEKLFGKKHKKGSAGKAEDSGGREDSAGKEAGKTKPFGLVKESGGENTDGQRKNSGQKNDGVGLVEERNGLHESRSAGSDAGGAKKGDANAVRKQKERYEGYMRVLDRMQPKRLRELRDELLTETLLEEEDKDNYLKCINKVLNAGVKKQLKEKADAVRRSPYAEIKRCIHEIKEKEYPEEIKGKVLDELNKCLVQKGNMEAESLIAGLPAEMDMAAYKNIREKLEQYEEIDIRPYQKQLESRHAAVEQKEIAAFVKHAPKRNREDLLKLCSRLSEQGFTEENTKPFLDKIHQKILEMDQNTINSIIPDTSDFTFQEGLAAYERISEGAFLPELKVNALEMIKRRLANIKEDENRQLVRKLRRSMEEQSVWGDRIYYCQCGEPEKEDREQIIKDNALNTYAAQRMPFEYPIVICDASLKGNGKSGFVLTPESLFYRGVLTEKKIDIRQIYKIYAEKGILVKGISFLDKSGKKIKLPNSVPLKEQETFVRVLGEFMKYLQEKPESRNISYLVKEKHEEKCCFRCGYVYSEGDTCPKCGSKENR